jgi:hypothetical protein
LFLIIPPTIIQREDYSDIEKRKTNYQKMMTDIDKTEFLKANIQRQKQLQSQPKLNLFN